MNKKYNCETCKYRTDNKYDFNRHKRTKKHQYREQEIVSIKNERPDNKLNAFRMGQLRAVAGGTNTGYSNIAKDYEGSYSSQRQELIEQARTYATLRGEFISVFIKPIYMAFVNMAVAQNLINTSEVNPLTLFDADHVGLGTAYIEPKRESDADLLTIQAGIKSLTKQFTGF